MAQEQKRDQTVRLPNPSAQPFVAALKTVRFFAVLFFWVAMVCVLAHVAAFVLTEWVGLYEEAEADQPSAEVPAEEAACAPASRARATAGPFGLAQDRLVRPWATGAISRRTAGQDPPWHTWLGLVESTAAAGQPGEPFPNVKPEQPAKTPPETTGREPAEPETPPPAPEPEANEEGVVGMGGGDSAKEGTPEGPENGRRAPFYRRVTARVLAPARVVGILASILLAVTVFLYLQIALLGRLAGIRQLTRALFLLLLFLVTVLPWGNVFEEVQVTALYDFEQLLSDHAAGAGASADWAEAGLYYGLYLVLPVVGVLLLSLAGIHFAGGYSRSVLANE